MELPTGTIERYVHDALGRLSSTWVGLDDVPTSGEWSPSNNSGADMVQVSAYVYDNDDVGDGYLTQLTLLPGGGAANRVTQQAFDWRGRLTAVKMGVEGSESTSTNRPIYYYEYDNLGQVTAVEQYDGDTLSITTDANSDGVPDKPSSSARRAYSALAYDEQGRVYRTEVYSVNQSTGALSTDTLQTDFFFDRRGYLIKTAAPGGLVEKFTYDGAGRLVKSYLSDGGGDSDWDDAGDVTGDHVFEQTEYDYDANSNVIFVIAKQHFHDDTNTGALGDVDTTPYARVSYMAYYYDEGARLTDVLDVGSNGGDAYTRPGSVPTRSDTERVWSYAYNDAGWLEETTDPRGIVTHQDYNNLGWVTRTVEAYTDGTPSAADDRTTEYTYNGSGNVLTVKAVLPSSAIQETKYIYESRTSAGSVVNSNDLLSAVQHPDPSSGSASSSQQETYTVNALGETTGLTDRNGNIHAYTFDVVGRFTADAVTTLGSGVDGTVRRLETAYDTAGRAFLFTSYDAATSGNVVNQVQRAFNGLGQLTTEWQAHAGAVNTGTSPKVQYAYSEMATAANHSRLVSMTYPDGRELTYNYASGLDDDISRLSAIVDDDETTLEAYQYLGLATVVVRAHPEPGVDLTYVFQTGDTDANDDGGDPYTGFDRFGQVIDQFWIDSADDATDRFQYTHDRAGNRLSKDNLLHTDFNEDYTYDDLSRLVAMARADGFDQSWDQDAQGNFDEVDTDGTPVSRTHNAQNEITVAGGANLTYDANGNLTTDENGNILIYDAWNRLVEVQDDQEQSLVRYERDALSRIIERTADSITTEFYYTVAWQVVEEQVDDEAVVQYVWSPVYVDALILRDRDTDANGSLDERLYVQQDANYNVTALVNTSGTVVERYVYTPYGERTVLEADWDVQGSSSVAFRQGHQGLTFEALVGLYLNRKREYSPTLMRFVGMDPKSFAAGYTNLYVAYGNGPGNNVDPGGLTHLPSDSRGTWVEGTRGNGVFQYADTAQNRAAGVAGARVRFRNQHIGLGGFPAAWYYGGGAAAASVQIPRVLGTDADFTAADEAMRRRPGNSNWQRPQGYTWNHAGGPGSRTMELVQRDLHARVAHTGSASVPRAQGRPARVGCMAALGVYLTLREAAQAAGIARPDRVPINAPHYFIDPDDGSVFVVREALWPRSMISNSLREYVAGPRAGQTEEITAADVARHRADAEAVWGRHIPGGPFRQDRFEPGSQRRTLPIIDSLNREIGLIDRDGEHYYDFPIENPA